jgi:hypothetical protein
MLCALAFHRRSFTFPGLNDAKHNEFIGEVNWVEIDIGKDSVNLDHLISPERSGACRCSFRLAPQ